MIHIVHRIEDLELEARHKDEKIKVLGRKLQLSEEAKIVQGATHIMEGRREVWQ